MSRIGQGIKKSVLTANSVLYAVTASVPAALSMAASRILGRKSSGNIAAMTVAELLTLINVAAGADVTGSNAPQAHKASHQDTGGDEISVAGLLGLLAADQHVLDSEVLAVAISKILMTTRGDIIFRNATVPARLAKGSSGDVLTMGANDPAWSAPAAAGATLVVAETEVFNGSSPASSAWTDLDLSGTIGANAALVLLKIASTSRADFIAVRKNGDTDQFYHSSMLGPGVSAVNVVLPNIHYVVLVATDSSGIIEWINEKTNISTITIDIIAYIK